MFIFIMAPLNPSSMSETKRSERLGARKKKPVVTKKDNPPGKSKDKGEPLQSPRGTLEDKQKRGEGLYPFQELEACTNASHTYYRPALQSSGTRHRGASTSHT